MEGGDADVYPTLVVVLSFFSLPVLLLCFDCVGLPVCLSGDQASYSGVFQVERIGPMTPNRKSARWAHIELPSLRFAITTSPPTFYLHRWSTSCTPSVSTPRQAKNIPSIWFPPQIALLSTGLSTLSRPGAAHGLAMIATTLSGMPVCVPALNRIAGSEDTDTTTVDHLGCRARHMAVLIVHVLASQDPPTA